ncbi:unnamed protein product [Clavelina lepadiformis]|uniref:Uncharacterized protein n=1 Tax=Clavelina lepadiformis TaxID=159417 RepID=A0ABP0FMB9_CLALP
MPAYEYDDCPGSAGAVQRQVSFRSVAGHFRFASDSIAADHRQSVCDLQVCCRHVEAVLRDEQHCRWAHFIFKFNDVWRELYEATKESRLWRLEPSHTMVMTGIMTSRKDEREGMIQKHQQLIVSVWSNTNH